MVKLISIDNEWDDQIKSFDFDIYHLSAWLNASSVIEEGQPKGIIATYNDIKVFIPIIVREINDGLWDATTPYGYGGPIYAHYLSHRNLDFMLTHIRNYLYEKGCISLFLRLHPILNQNWDTSDNIGTTVVHGPTLVSDLSKTEEEHWLETQRRHRKDINKAKRSFLDIKIEPLSEHNIPTFLPIYIDTMERNKANIFYFFDADYFYKLSADLKDRLLLFTAYYNEKPISSILCTHCKESGIIQSHLGGTLTEYQNLYAYKLLTHLTRSWGRENGYKLLHFGGGVGAEKDTLYEFKKGFSSDELSFKTYRMIVNPEIYSNLCVSHLSKNKLKCNNFFPQYRA